MNPSEAMQLLAHAAAFDNRQPSKAAAQAWAAALKDVPLDDDALAAIARYYGTPTPGDAQKWIQPHHVRAHRKTIRDERLAREPEPAPAADPADEEAYRRALAGIRGRIGGGHTPGKAIPAAAMTSSPTDAYRETRRAMGARRDNRVAVLAYPDLAQRLTEPPLGYERPDQWNGFVPPATYDQRRNDSARRDALAEIVAEAHRRDAEEDR